MGALCWEEGTCHFKMQRGSKTFFGKGTKWLSRNVLTAVVQHTTLISAIIQFYDALRSPKHDKDPSDWQASKAKLLSRIKTRERNGAGERTGQMDEGKLVMTQCFKMLLICSWGCASDYFNRCYFERRYLTDKSKADTLKKSKNWQR